MVRSRLLPVVAAALHSAFALAAAGEVPVTGDAIRAALADKRGRLVPAEGGFTADIHWKADGTIAGEGRKLIFRRAITGTWTVRGDRYCRTLSIGDPSELCQSIVRTADGALKFFDPDGRFAGTVTFR